MNMFHFFKQNGWRVFSWLGLSVMLVAASVGCGSGGECTQNSDCKTEQVCQNQKCITSSGCKADTDCKANQTCNNGTCQDKTAPPSCKADSDCKQEETCKEGKCVPKEGTCKADKDCKSGEVCVGEKVCVKKFTPCSKNGDCAPNEICAEVTTGKTACIQKCDPTANDKTDNSNKGCWDGWGLCLRLSEANPNLGICVPPKLQNRKQGESCGNLEDFTKPDYNDCESGLNCIGNKCIPNCKESEGTATNPVCEKGFYCKEENGKGLCKPLPPKQTGSRELGQACSNNSANFACDGSNKGLFCATNRCLQACDPRAGKENNPICKKSEICQEFAEFSYLGGGCTPTPTQKQDEACDNDRLCLEGLSCSGGRCQKACTKAADCGTEEACSTTFNVCVKKCDPTKGGSGNPACTVGYTCTQSTTTPPGYCRALPTFDQGKRKKGEDCSNVNQAEFCDGSQQLYCSRSKCTKACDLRKGTTSNASCESNEECSESNSSPLGGTCLPKATQKENETCDNTSQRCMDDLTCRLGRCQRTCTTTSSDPNGDCKAEEWCLRTTRTCTAKCDPAKDVIGNASCPKDYYCAADTGTHKPGYCAPLPSAQNGSKQAGESCSTVDSRNFCDGSKGLACYGGVCVKACNPKDGTDSNPTCGSAGICELNTQQSHLGGVCIPVPAQKENDECDDRKRCVKGLLCVDLGAKSYCQVSCDPKQSNCPTGTTCETVPRTQDSYCAIARKKVRKANEVCLGQPGTPAYDDCESGYTCQGQNGADSHCLKECTPNGDPCPTGFSCQFAGRARACVQDCKTDADCKAYGGACRTIGSTGYCL